MTGDSMFFGLFNTKKERLDEAIAQANLIYKGLELDKLKDTSDKQIKILLFLDLLNSGKDIRLERFLKSLNIEESDFDELVREGEKNE